MNDDCGGGSEGGRGERRVMAITPVFDYLPRQITHSLTTAPGSSLFVSVVRTLDFYLGRPGSNPTIGGIFSALLMFCAK